ncbi:helix-turn-helix domain-containing protein [Lysobacter sp. F6437]|uniref:helix-turn-helix domain-containing protein n=1 Tax=Lysobacter sp. F6437 TaxID=3459296 RepID=UPI00403D6B2E
MKSEQAGFGARLREALQKAKLPESAAELARLVPQYGGTAVTTAAAHRWIKGQSIPRPENIRALATLLRVPLDWLYGEEPGGSKVREPKVAWEASVVDRHAVDAFLSLDDGHRKLVRELIAALAKVANR